MFSRFPCFNRRLNVCHEFCENIFPNRLEHIVRVLVYVDFLYFQEFLPAFLQDVARTFKLMSRVLPELWINGRNTMFVSQWLLTRFRHHLDLGIETWIFASAAQEYQDHSKRLPLPRLTCYVALFDSTGHWTCGLGLSFPPAQSCDDPSYFRLNCISVCQLSQNSSSSMELKHKELPWLTPDPARLVQHTKKSVHPGIALKWFGIETWTFLVATWQ